MHFVRKDELFELDPLPAKRLRQLHRLPKLDVAVVVAVDEQHRAPPALHVGQRRGIQGQAQGVLLHRQVVGWQE